MVFNVLGSGLHKAMIAFMLLSVCHYNTLTNSHTPRAHNQPSARSLDTLSESYTSDADDHTSTASDQSETN